MRYTVVYDRTAQNYGAYVPHLPVVVIVADTFAELEQEARSAIAFHLEGTEREGEPFEVELVADADYDGDMITLDGKRIPAKVAPSATGA
jgi:predicted RNase H-like HicB family nuclease